MYQAACVETLKQVCALVFREVEEVWLVELKDSGEWAEEGCGTILKNEAGAKSSRVWLL